MRKTLRTGWWMMALAVLLPATGCNRKQANAAVPEAVASPVAAPSSWAVHTARLGFIAHLPADTEACFGTLNLPAHTAALKETNYFKELTAFLDDKTPAPAAAAAVAEKKSDKPKVFEKLLGDDVFISLGKGAAKSILGWQQFSSFYSEMMYRGLMAGATPGAKPGSGEKEQMLSTLVKNPDMIKRVAAAVTDLQLPPLMMGVRTDKPDEILKELLPEDLLAQIKKKAKVSQVTTNLNGKFTLIEATGKDIFTDQMKKQWIEGLPADAAASLPEINQALAALQAKPFVLAYGTADGYLIVSLGSTRPSLEFATDAASSVVSRPEFASLAPYEGKNLVAVFFADGTTLQSLQNPEPLQPMARGVLAGLKASPMFATMAKNLEGKVAALAPLEHELYAKPMTTAIGAAWWDKGLHVESEGGLSPKGMESKPLKFASLVDDPNAVAAMNYHGDPLAAATLRTYLEGWADVIHVAAQELAKANMFGQEGPKMATWIDQEVIPRVVTFYNGSKTLYTKALGNEHAWIMDLGGQMPALPGMAAPDPKVETKMVRIVGMYDVVDRQLIGSSWAQMNDSLNTLAKAFPMLAGQKLPEPDVSNNSGVTCYSFPLPMLGSDDLLFCASVSDKLFMLGTSRTQQEDLAARLLRASPGAGTPTMLWRLNCPKLREALKGLSPAVPAAPAADNLKTATKWMAPLGDLRGRMWIESGRVRSSVSWEMKDTVKFD